LSTVLLATQKFTDKSTLCSTASNALILSRTGRAAGRNSATTNKRWIKKRSQHQTTVRCRQKPQLTSRL